LLPPTPAPSADAVRARPVVGFGEISARVGGKNWWQWVLLGSTAICYVIANMRAASVVTAFMNGACPEAWMADRYGGQLGHGAVRQMCLAHLLRDATYAIDEGEEGFTLGFRFLLLRAVAIGRRRDALKDRTLAPYHANLESRLNRLLPGALLDKPAARCLVRAAPELR
jgi:transposase